MDSTMAQIQDFLTVGGPVVWILLGFSMIGVTQRLHAVSHDTFDWAFI